jgi:hypothetical protein
MVPYRRQVSAADFFWAKARINFKTFRGAERRSSTISQYLCAN